MLIDIPDLPGNGALLIIWNSTSVLRKRPVLNTVDRTPFNTLIGVKEDREKAG
jgi:hypothetical protein